MRVCRVGLDVGARSLVRDFAVGVRSLGSVAFLLFVKRLRQRLGLLFDSVATVCVVFLLALSVNLCIPRVESATRLSQNLLSLLPRPLTSVALPGFGNRLSDWRSETRGSLDGSEGEVEGDCRTRGKNEEEEEEGASSGDHGTSQSLVLARRESAGG